MKIHDFVYGDFEINDPVLIALIKSQPVQRLKGIAQYGIPKEYCLFPGFSRFDHSIGVMLLLAKIGASQEEQVAGLLHDISHTAFSHVFDWIVGSSDKENFQDENHKSILDNSEIPKILAEFRFSTERITNIKRYCYLEREIPDLCADRIDYALREFKYWTNPEAAMVCSQGLIRFEDKIVFDSKSNAKIFGVNFLKCQREHWGEAETVLRYHLFSEILRIALSDKTIEITDFYADDDFIINKLKSSKSILIKRLLRMMTKKLKYEINNRNPKLKLRKKFRYVDPWYVEDGMLCLLSKTDTFYNNFIEEQKRINEGGVNIDLLF